MPMYNLTSVQKGYMVNDLVVDWGKLDEQDKLSLIWLSGG